MKMLTHRYSTNNTLVDFIEKEQLFEYDNILIQIFSGVIEKKNFLTLAHF